VSLRSELFVQQMARFSPLLHYAEDSVFVCHRRFTHFSANTASVSMNNLVSTGSSTIASTSVVERIIVIRTISLAGVT
jgi:hypothetical protein